MNKDSLQITPRRSHTLKKQKQSNSREHNSFEKKLQNSTNKYRTDGAGGSCRLQVKLSVCRLRSPPLQARYTAVRRRPAPPTAHPTLQRLSAQPQPATLDRRIPPKGAKLTPRELLYALFADAPDNRTGLPNPTMSPLIWHQLTATEQLHNMHHCTAASTLPNKRNCTVAHRHHHHPLHNRAAVLVLTTGAI